MTGGVPYADPRRTLQHRKEYHQRHRERLCAKSRAYYAEHRERARELRRLRYLRSKEAHRSAASKYYREHRDQIRAWAREHNAKPEIKSRARARRAERYQNDPQFRLASVLRGRIRRAFKDGAGAKAAKSMALLGCDIPALKRHLESRFKKGMSWRNYGVAWHIDHIIPCSAFDLRDERQQRQCFHFTNLQPLPSRENIQKSDSITDPQLKLLL